MKGRMLFLFFLWLAGHTPMVGQPTSDEAAFAARSDTLLQENDRSVLSRIVRLPGKRQSVYQWLSEITDQTGFLFIYDSKSIDNEQKVRVRAGSYALAEAIRKIADRPTLRLRVIGNHILLQTADAGSTSFPAKMPSPPSQPTFFTLEGTVEDPYTKEPIAFGSVGMKGTSLGTVTNQNGEFRLLVPDSLRSGRLVFSHLGYQPKELACEALERIHPSIALEPRVIPIQEVVIRRANPLRLLDEMRTAVATNYSRRPVYHTVFYREGIERKKGFVSLTEAVFKIYKTPYRSLGPADQVKLLKMRRISNEQEKDTLVTRMKSGVNACLMLDVIKHFPDFLLPEEEDTYQYAHTDMTVVENRLVNVIAFEQRRGVQIPLYKGELYLDAVNGALVQTCFEVNPRYVRKAAGMFVERKSKDLRITPQKVVYTVSYKSWNGVYYIHHIRGDLHFKIKKRKQLFNTVVVHTWFEMVTCKTDTSEVHRFTRQEILPTRSIFAETRFAYDAKFWEGFNVILPEEKLSEAIGKITSKIEETTE